MLLKHILLVCLSILLTEGSSLAFVGCQPKYDNHPRALNKLKGNCGVCHINPSGSGPQNNFGKAFKSAGFTITNELISQFPELFTKEETNEETTEGATNGTSGVTTTPAPVIKRVKPKKLKLGVETTLKIKGNNFVEGAKVFIDENEFVTEFRSNMLLFLEAVLEGLGIHKLKVTNPDGQESDTFDIKVVEPKKKKSKK